MCGICGGMERIWGKISDKNVGIWGIHGNILYVANIRNDDRNTKNTIIISSRCKYVCMHVLSILFIVMVRVQETKNQQGEDLLAASRLQNPGI